MISSNSQEDIINKAALVYFSPYKSTKKTGDEIVNNLSMMEYTCDYFNIAQDEKKVCDSLYSNLDSYNLLVIGGPVYCEHMVGAIERFLKNLPQGEKEVIIYATFGGVCSGKVLPDMATILNRKGYKIISAAKVMSEHSMMFKSKKPLGREKPGKMNGPKLRTMVETALGQKNMKNGTGLTVKELTTQTMFVRVLLLLLFNPKVMYSFFLPRVLFNPSKCNSCNACSTTCPAENISEISLSPTFSDEKCLRCYNCVRVCKQGVYTARLKSFSYTLRVFWLLSFLFEKQETEIFFPQNLKQN